MNHRPSYECYVSGCDEPPCIAAFRARVRARANFQYYERSKPIKRSTPADRRSKEDRKRQAERQREWREKNQERAAQLIKAANERRKVRQSA